MPEENEDQPDPMELSEQHENISRVCWIAPGERLRAGMTCPRCSQGKLDYDGLLQLTCPVCGLTETGACT